MQHRNRRRRRPRMARRRRGIRAAHNARTRALMVTPSAVKAATSAVRTPQTVNPATAEPTQTTVVTAPTVQIVFRAVAVAPASLARPARINLAPQHSAHLALRAGHRQAARLA